jgi:hypothetical protein
MGSTTESIINKFQCSVPHIIKNFFPMPPHVHTDFVVPPPGCGRSVTDFVGWGSDRAQLRCPDDVSDYIYERGVPGGALNLNSTG